MATTSSSSSTTPIDGMDVDDDHENSNLNNNENENDDDEPFELAASYTFGEAGVRVAGVVGVGTTTQQQQQQQQQLLVLGDQLGGMASFDWLSPTKDLTLLPPHDDAVTALLVSEDGRYYVTGCKDSHIRIYSSKEHTLLKQLKGHDKPVTSLAWVRPTTTIPSSSADAEAVGVAPPPPYYLVSGSWDGTAKLWNIDQFALVATLPDHENSVCVAGLPPAGPGSVRVATGSAGVAVNNTICHHAVRLWTIDIRTGQVHLDHRLEHDHEGPIRGLCTWGDDNNNNKNNHNNHALASCSNDGTVKVRDIHTGQTVSTLTFVPDDTSTQPQGQEPPMLLSVTALVDLRHPFRTCVVAGAEDGQVIVWDLSPNNPRPPQILRHAACVWNVVALPHGDLGTCCQDGHFYVFTRNRSQWADESVRLAWSEAANAAHTRLHQGPTSEEVARLPHWHNSSNLRGTSEGQVQLFQRDGSALAAQWSAASQTWIEVGQVVGSSNDQGLLDGIRYDHILPIEVDTPSGGGGGVAQLQIGYNNGENPFVAAQRFIDTHVLPQYHLAEIADYITQRVGSAASRTLGSAAAAGETGTAPRTVPPAATTGVPLASYAHLPAKAYLTFSLTEKTAASTLTKMKAKVEGFQRLSAEQLVTLSSLMDTLGDTNRYQTTHVTDSELQLVAHMLEHWSLSQCFPALDLARMAALHPDATSSARALYWSDVLPMVFALQGRLQDSAESDVDATARGAIPLLSLRLLANAFGDRPGPREAAGGRVVETVRVAAQQLRASTTGGGKALRLAVATVLHNLCRYLHSSDPVVTLPPEVVAEIVSLCRDMLSRRDCEGDAVYRTLVGLGTLVLSPNPNGPLAKEAARNLFLSSAVEPAASPHGSSVKAVAKEVYAVLA